MLRKGEEKIIRTDVERTFQDTPYFQSEEGRESLITLLCTISKHPSAVGYTQGMNNIAGSLLYHTSEVIAFSLLYQLLNNYHLKEVHMHGLPDLKTHCKVLDKLVKDNLPKLSSHLESHELNMLSFSQNWIISLFTQVIPLNKIQIFYSLFWKHEWLTVYRLVLVVMAELEP